MRASEGVRLARRASASADFGDITVAYVGDIGAHCEIACWPPKCPCCEFDVSARHGRIVPKVSSFFCVHSWTRKWFASLHRAPGVPWQGCKGPSSDQSKMVCIPPPRAGDLHDGAKAMRVAGPENGLHLSTARR